MANKRPLSLYSGVQKQIQDSDYLDVGNQGIIAQNWNNGEFVPVTLNIASSANFKRDVVIDGDLKVTGDASVVDTLVTTTTFNQTVQFGDDAAQDKAQFTSAIQMDTGAAAWLKTSLGDLTFDAQAGSVLVNGAKAVADAIKLRASNAAGGVLVEAGSSGISLKDPVATLKLDGSGKLTDAGGVLASIDLDPTGAIALDADAASHFKTSVGDLTFGAEAGSVLVNGAKAVADAIKLHASNAAGGVQVVAGSNGISLQDPVATLKLDGSGNLTDAGDVLASIDLDPTGAITLDADAASHFKTAGADQHLTLESADANLVLTGAQRVLGSSQGYVEFKAGTPAFDEVYIPATGGAGNIYMLAAANAYFAAEFIAQLRSEGSDPTQHGTLLTAAHVVMAATDGASVAAAGGQRAHQGLPATGEIIISAKDDLRMWSDELVRIESAKDMQLDALGSSRFKVDAAAGQLTLESKKDTSSKVLVDAQLLEMKGIVSATLDAATFSIDSTSSSNLSMTADDAAALQTLTIRADNTSGNAKLSATAKTVVFLANDADGTKGKSQLLIGPFSAGEGLNEEGAYLFLAQGGKTTLSSAKGEDLEVIASAAEKGNLLLGAVDEVRLRPGSGDHIIVMKSDGSAPTVTDPTHAHAKIRNVADPEQSQDVVTKGYMERNGGGTVSMIAGEALAKGDLVYIGAEGKVFLAQASDNHYVLGMATEAAATDAAVLVRMLGKFESGVGTFAAADIGAPLYLSEVGDFSKTAPSTEGHSVQRIGFLAGLHDTDKAVVIMAIGEPVIL
jgi:hypothetical protein